MRSINYANLTETGHEYFILMPSPGMSRRPVDDDGCLVCVFCSFCTLYKTSLSASINNIISHIFYSLNAQLSVYAEHAESITWMLLNYYYSTSANGRRWQHMAIEPSNGSEIANISKYSTHKYVYLYSSVCLCTIYEIAVHNNNVRHRADLLSNWTIEPHQTCERDEILNIKKKKNENENKQ